MRLPPAFQELLFSGRAAMGRTAIGGMSWSTALRLGRVSNLPTVWTNVLAGIVLSDAAVTAPSAVLLLLSLSLFYVAGMFPVSYTHLRAGDLERAVNAGTRLTDFRDRRSC